MDPWLAKWTKVPMPLRYQCIGNTWVSGFKFFSTNWRGVVECRAECARERCCRCRMDPTSGSTGPTCFHESLCGASYRASAPFEGFSFNQFQFGVDLRRVYVSHGCFLSQSTDDQDKIWWELNCILFSWKNCQS